jgi:phi13 family phage major tail protein
MAKINIDKFWLALLTKDEIGTGNLTFSKPEYIPGIQQFQAKVKTNSGENYAEGILTDTNSTLQNVEITININDFTNAQRTKYLGHHSAATGGSYALGEDEAPYVAALIQYTKANGKKGFKVFYKGKFEEPDDSIKQKEGKIDYQNDSASSSFLPLKNNGMWKYTVDEDDPNCPADIKTRFFDEVMVPTEGTAEAVNNISLSSVIPADGTSNVALNVQPTLTFNNQISKNDIILLNDGGIVTSTKVFDATGKILTIEPSVALTASKKYSIVVTGVEDIYGQKLAQSIISFTTASA